MPSGNSSRRRCSTPARSNCGRCAASSCSKRNHARSRCSQGTGKDPALRFCALSFGPRHYLGVFCAYDAAANPGLLHPSASASGPTRTSTSPTRARRMKKASNGATRYVGLRCPAPASRWRFHNGGSTTRPARCFPARSFPRARSVAGREAHPRHRVRARRLPVRRRREAQ